MLDAWWLYGQIKTDQQRVFCKGIALRCLEQLIDTLPWLLAILLIKPLQTGALTAQQLSLLAVLCGFLWWARWCFSKGAKLTFSASYKMMHQLRLRLCGHLQQLPLMEVQGRSLGELHKFVTRDLQLFEELFTHILAEVIAHLVVIALVLILLLSLDFQLSLVLILPLLLAFFCSRLLTRWFLQKAAVEQHRRETTMSLLLEYLEGLTTLKLFNRTQRLVDPLNQSLEQLKEAGLGLEKSAGSSVKTAGFIVEMTLVVLLLMASFSITEKAALFNVEHWLIFLLATMAVTRPMLSIFIFSTKLSYMLTACKRICQLLKTPTQVVQGSAPHNFCIEFKNVSFRHLGAISGVENLHFTLKPNTTTAIVGPSGAGKSTLLNLVAMFVNPDQGEVCIGDLPLAKIGSENLYRHISFVMQEVQLFAGTLKQNLLLGRSEASDRQLLEACAQAQLSELIERLPQGLATKIGENGARLSGGERQRLSIARAILKDAPILLLDEVTASLDLSHQKAIVAAFANLSLNRTVLVVAHRLETLQNADQIILLDKGRQLAIDTHQNLLAQQPLYRELWSSNSLKKM